jgi:hypothetical protein
MNLASTATQTVDGVSLTTHVSNSNSVQSTVVKSFICPSDPSYTTEAPNNFAFACYAANALAFSKQTYNGNCWADRTAGFAASLRELPGHRRRPR